MQKTFDAWEGTCLIHHGIKGQKWGVRRYRNPDGTLTAAGRARYGFTDTGTGGNRRAQKAFNKGVMRLTKLGQKADVNLQRAISAKYGKKAAVSGLAALGIGGAAVKSYTKDLKSNREFSDVQLENSKFYDKAASDVRDTLIRYNNKGLLDNETYRTLRNDYDDYVQRYYSTKALSDSLYNQSKFGAAGSSSLRTKALAGAAAVAGGYAVYSAIRSKVAKNRTTTEGHKKAVAKYKKQYDKMVNMFANTPYSELVRRQRKNVQ